MNELEVIKFAASKVPEFWESKETNDDRFVSYGRYNEIPNYLLNLYNECGPHASIIENKGTYIIGDGLQYENGSDLDFKANAADNVKELVNKVVKDYLIFNYFAIEVIYNALNEPIEYHHIPSHKIRANNNKTRFGYNEDWTKQKKPVIYDRWTPNSEDSNSKIFFFDGYFPSVNNVYTRPEYMAAINSIEADIALKKFNKNNIQNHFSPSHIVTFFQGANVSKETKEEASKKIKDSFTGESGEKIILDFQNVQGGKPAEVKSLSAGDWDKAYVETGKNVKDDIFIAHQVTSPILFGVKTEGQLGGTTEMEAAFHIFKTTYVKGKRDALESAFNLLFSNNKTITGKVKFGDSPLFPPQVSESVKEKVMTINEIRKEMGLAPRAGGDRLLSEQAPQAPVAMEEETEVVKKKPTEQPTSRKLTEEDYELVKDFGSLGEDFEIIGDYDGKEHLKFDAESDIADYVIKEDIRDLTINELNTLIQDETSVNVSNEDLKGILDRLNDAGVINVEYNEGKVKVTPSKIADVPDSDAVFVMYKYVKRPEVKGGDLVPESRSFCIKMIENNRLYKRSEIQQMSSIFGYDIFTHTGGFYHNPETGVTTNYCRHMWKALSVKRKAK